MSHHNHDHHDHSNCNHDHGSHDAKKMTAASEEISLRQQAADKIAKVMIQFQELANEHKKSTLVKASVTPVDKANVELLMKEMQITKADAEAALRNNDNNVVAALNFLVSH